MPKTVFISYRRADEPLAAALLYSLLVEVLPKRNVFLDLETIKPGEVFPDRLNKAILHSEIFLMVVGQAWDGKPTVALPSRLFDERDFVRREVVLALRENKVIVPLFLGASDFGQQKIPPEIEAVRQLHGFCIRPDHFKYDAHQMFIEAGICSVEELSIRKGGNEALSRLQDRLLSRYVSDVMKVAIGAGIGSAVGVTLTKGVGARTCKVAVYSTPWSHYGQAARRFLTAHGVEFINHDISRDGEKRNEMVEKSGQMGEPVIVVGDELIVGFNEPRLRSVLSRYGH